jgi:hypothetical protein
MYLNLYLTSICEVPDCPYGFETVQEIDLKHFYNFGKEMRTLSLKEKTPIKTLIRLLNKQVCVKIFLNKP